MAMDTIVNLSGHNLQDLAVKKVKDEGFVNIINVPIPNVDMGVKDSVVSFVKDLVKEVKKVEIHKTCLIFPGLSPITAILLAGVHGTNGHFPCFRWLVKTDDGFMPGPIVDLQEIRQMFRDFRQGDQ